ncbi:MAG: undecaprenyldiphospho-muramoylpentapeptide beta-N-acetylglucosaminyltransferase [Flavobacteriales bacterium]|nr:MAG: undecaprenyldiphospho-muramoylpentapeptide beta-N-acetylglucosaminyltransferase [Flavobacteriales bacterium]
MGQVHRKYRIILSGGGTGGHIFPAVSIADRFRARHPDAEILFVGAEGRMEMTRVPEAGYRIIGLPIAGIQRSLSMSNLAVPFKLAASLWRARKVVRDFRPDIAVGTGGYASGPVLFAASMAGVPTLIQEQNGFAGVTNKILAKRAAKICVAYEGLERVFPKDKIVLTGNPVRASILDGKKSRQEALDEFSLSAGRKTFLVLGGSLGARAVNNAVFESIDTLASDGSQLLWQCGKLYYNQYRRELDRLVAEHPEKDLENRVALVPFISDMNAAYSVADFIISRAGAGTISELCIVGKPSVLIPSPNVAEDHQRHNAQALSSKGAAVFIPESENLSADLSLAAARLLSDASLCSELSRNISSMARPDATSDIVDEIEKLLPAI